jgi:hypothetical protein
MRRCGHRSCWLVLSEFGVSPRDNFRDRDDSFCAIFEEDIARDQGKIIEEMSMTAEEETSLGAAGLVRVASRPEATDSAWSMWSLFPVNGR